MKNRNVKLKDILTNFNIKEQEFEYAGIKGVAELLGWQIIFFFKPNDLDNTAVMCFNEIDTTELINTANSILKFIDMDIRFGDYIDTINGVYGNADFIDSLYEDIIRYNYIISSNLFIAFGLKGKMLSCLEIVTDEGIIKEIVGVRMPDRL